MRTFGRLIAAAVMAMAVLAGTSGLAVASASPRDGAAPARKAPAACSPEDVLITASTNHRSYPPGENVVMTSAVTNESAASCVIYLGLDPGFSPVFNVTNAKGKTVWDRCWRNDEPAACFEIVKAHTLRAGKTYRQQATWDQRSGPDGGPVRQVPQGVYTFTTAFAGLPQAPSADFDIIVGEHSSR